MSNAWPLVPLGQVLIQDRDYIDAPEPRLYPKLSVKLYGKGVQLDGPADGCSLRMKKHQLAKPGQVILSEIWGKKGAIGFVPADGDGALCTSHFFLFDINRDQLDPAWLGFIFRANFLQDQLDAGAHGTTGYAAVRPAHLLAATIPLPPLNEQRRLVARIEALAGKIEEANGLRNASTQEAIALSKASRRNLIGNKRSGEWVPLSRYVARIENGWSPPCEKRPACEGEWAVLKVGAVSFGFYDPRQNKALPISLSPMPEYEVKVGDFLMSRANTYELVGACAVVQQTPRRLMLSDKHFRFVFREDTMIDRAYLDHVLKSPALREQIVQGATGTSSTMKNISKEKVLALRIPQHSQAQQRRIAGQLGRIENKISSLVTAEAETAAELDALLPAILDRAFKGEL